MHNCPQMDNSTVLAGASEVISQTVCDYPLEEGLVNESGSKKQTSSFNSEEENDTSGLLNIRRKYVKYGISSTTTDLIMNSWRKGTKKQYNVYINISFSVQIMD